MRRQVRLAGSLPLVAGRTSFEARVLRDLLFVPDDQTNDYTSCFRARRPSRSRVFLIARLSSRICPPEAVREA